MAEIDTSREITRTALTGVTSKAGSRSDLTRSSKRAAQAPRVYVSGVHSGPNPSPGLGVALCIREAFPTLELLAVDYSVASTGLHDASFDQVVVQRPWNKLDLPSYSDFVASKCREGAWIPCLDLEIAWFRSVAGDVDHYLAPRRQPLEWTTKPAADLAARMGMLVPATMSLAQSDNESYGFAERYGPNLWVKGPRYEALAVDGWKEIAARRDEVATRWSGTPLLQQHIDGTEGALSFAAWHGTLLGAVVMSKRAVTPDGKTWAGDISVPSKADLRRLEAFCCATKYTGGGELEFIERHQKRYLIDFNPRFPAWIRGASLAGHNLPGALIAADLGISLPSKPTTTHRQFVRVVTEIPVRDGLVLPKARRSKRLPIVAKHPSGMPALARVMRARTMGSRTGSIPPSIMEDLGDLDNQLETPAHIRLPRETNVQFSSVADALSSAASQCGIDLKAAYSVKTNPAAELVHQAIASGMGVEVIGRDELDWAWRLGVPSNAIVLNGPNPWGFPRTTKLLAWFADSEEALGRWLASREIGAQYIGIRIRPRNLESRFGLDLSSNSRIRESTRLIRRVPTDQSLGVQFHVGSGQVGISQWQETLRHVVTAASALASESERTFECFDVGGGFPADLAGDELEELLNNVVRTITQSLSGVRIVLMEPGRLLAQSSGALMTRVVERRDVGGRSDLVVDASIADLPLVLQHPHRLAIHDGLQWRPARSGKGRILGRSCMEQDVLAENIAVPRGIGAGTLLAMLDAGAYDRSMAYRFGRGLLGDELRPPRVDAHATSVVR